MAITPTAWTGGVPKTHNKGALLFSTTTASTNQNSNNNNSNRLRTTVLPAKRRTGSVSLRLFSNNDNHNHNETPPPPSSSSSAPQQDKETNDDTTLSSSPPSPSSKGELLPLQEEVHQPQTQQQPDSSCSKSRVVSAALLIAGITVGGGFLALPTVVAPNGFVPSAFALVGVWAFFGAQSFVVVEALCRTRIITQLRNNNNNKKKKKNQPPQQQLDCSQETDEEFAEGEDFPGMAAAAKAAFGTVGERLVMGLLILVVEATLVSQISRAGAMIVTTSSSSSKVLSYRAGCAVAALSVAAVVFGPSSAKRREQVTTSLNSVLTVIFCAMAVLLFAKGLPAVADWTHLTAIQNWKTIPETIPTFLQLLVYGEILPTICHYLHYQIGPIRWAIGIGSILPLILEVGWAALGIGLSPAAAAAAAATTTTTTVMMVEDPVTLLLAAGPIQVPLLWLAFSAILTTILGSYLALQSTLDDVFFAGGGAAAGWKSTQTTTSMESAEPPENDESFWTTTVQLRKHHRFVRRIKSAAWIVLPALSIASISPSLFLRAIDFAGSYPVLLLWGIAPPAIVLRLRRRQQQQQYQSTLGRTTSSNLKEGGLPDWWIKGLLAIALGLFGMSAAPDISNLGRLVVQFAKEIFV